METGAAREIVNFLETYEQHFKELRLFLIKKQDKVAADDLIWLLDSLNEEQRLIMRGNSLEAKRLTLFDSLGFKDYKSTMIIDESPKEFKGRLRVLLISMQDNIDFIKNSNEDILDLIEKKLETQEELLNETGLTGNKISTYTSSGEKIKKSGDFDGDIIGSV